MREDIDADGGERRNDDDLSRGATVENERPTVSLPRGTTVSLSGGAMASGKKVRFGHREFCLVTGLRFGELSEIINTPYMANANGIHKRDFDQETPIKGNARSGTGYTGSHGLLRMRRWTMYKRPRNCVQIISDIEANIRAGKVQVLEELKATDDESGAYYWEGVDFDMSMGESGDKDDVGDRGTHGQKKKRKAPKQKKKTSTKKGQRKTVPITILAEEDPLPSPHSPEYTYTQHDDPLSIGFTPGYTPAFPEGMDGDMINDLLKVMKALPDLLEGVVKREAPMTDVRDPSSHVEQEVDTNVSTEQEVGPSGQKDVDEEGLVNGDLRVNYNYALEEDRSVCVIAPLHLLTRHGSQG
ncbi:hypothetical protein QYF36_026056 [Acer negundo]|nr:hypothetical protein QYF36_026056 [Acer negundo]